MHLSQFPRKTAIVFALMAIGLATHLVPAAQAAPEQFVFDDTHTDILFAVSHLGFSKTYGRFNRSEGLITLDASNPENSSVEVTIDASSIDSNLQKRDDHLRGGDFFNVATHPTITYKSTEISVTGENTAMVTGDLTMLGVTKPVTLDVTLNKAGPSPAAPDKTVAGFSATATLKRSDFGMTYGLPVLGDEVEMIFEIEAFKQP